MYELKENEILELEKLEKLEELDFDLCIDKRGDGSTGESDFFDRTKKIEFEIPKEQEETGKEIDNAFKREILLRNNPNDFQLSDYTKILYRLPIREDVMDKIYKDIINNK